MLLVNCIRHNIDLASQVALPGDDSTVELILRELPSTQVTPHGWPPAKSVLPAKVLSHDGSRALPFALQRQTPFAESRMSPTGPGKGREAGPSSSKAAIRSRSPAILHSSFKAPAIKSHGSIWPQVCFASFMSQILSLSLLHLRLKRNLMEPGVAMGQRTLRMHFHIQCTPWHCTHLQTTMCSGFAGLIRVQESDGGTSLMFQ